MLIGKSIKHFRKKLGLSQSELAEKSGITQTYLSQLESDKKTPHAPTLKSLCDAMGIKESLVYMYSLESGDVHESKRPAFELLKHSVKGLIEEIIDDLIKERDGK